MSPCWRDLSTRLRWRWVTHHSGIDGCGNVSANALATNKLQACGGSISATIYFIRRKVVSLSDQKLNIAMTFVGSMSGALLVQYVQADVLRQILPILVICIGLYFLLMPKLGEEDRQRRMYGLPFALIAVAASVL